MIKILFFVIGVVLGGSCVGAFLTGSHKHKRVGKLRMDNSTGEPYLFMELMDGIPVQYVLGQKQILLEVDLTPLTQDSQPL